MENFENYFKDNLQDIDELPPYDGWKRISGALDEGGRRHTYVWAAILFLICLSADSMIDRKTINGEAYKTAASSTLLTSDSVDPLSVCLPFEMSSGNLSAEVSNEVAIYNESELDRPLVKDNPSRSTVDHNRTNEILRNTKEQSKNQLTLDVGRLQSQQKVQSPKSNVTENYNVLVSGDRLGQSPKSDSLRSLQSGVIHQEADGMTIAGQSNNELIEKDGSTLTIAETLTIKQDSIISVIIDPVDGKQKDGEGNRKKRRFAKWYYQANVGLNYTMKKINPTEDIYYMARLNNTNQFTGKNAGYQFSFRVRREVSDKYTFVLGASYSWLRETTNFDYYNIIADSLVIGNVSETEIQVQAYSPIRNNVVENSVSYGGITLGLMRKINLLRVEQSIFIEGRYHRVLSHSHSTLDRDHRFLPNPNQFFIKAGLEKCFRIREKYSLSIAPFAQYSLGSIYGQESLYSLRPIQFGLDLGLVIVR